jgi:hypothetical protein
VTGDPTLAYWRRCLDERAAVHGSTATWWQLMTRDLEYLVDGLLEARREVSALRAEVARLNQLVRLNGRS